MTVDTSDFMTHVILTYHWSKFLEKHCKVHPGVQTLL
jgi:hypothetical protein